MIEERKRRWYEELKAGDWTPTYSSWRHGGWYVDNLTYPSGAVGCVATLKPGKLWAIACDMRPGDYTYTSRDAAAYAERELVLEEWLETYVSLRREGVGAI